MWHTAITQSLCKVRSLVLKEVTVLVRRLQVLKQLQEVTVFDF